MKLRVILVDDNPRRRQLVGEALCAVGCEVLGEGDAATLAARVVKEAPDVIIIHTDTPDRDTLEHLRCVSRNCPRPVVMFTDNDDSEKMRQALRAGVSAYVVRGFDSGRVKSIVDLAVARFETYQSLQRELAAAQASLAERKIVERAKGIVMAQRQCTEEEAYRALRRLAMDRNKRLIDVAENVIVASELLG